MKKSIKQIAQHVQSDTSSLEQLCLPVVPAKEITQDPSDNWLVRPEMHMFLRPYFLLDKHGDKTIGFETREVVAVNGKQIERHWCVTPDKEYGMPGPIERDVLLALYEIAYEQYLSKGLSVPEIMHIGSIRKFLNRIGLSNCGQSAAAIKLALKRLVHTVCKSENSFFDKRRNLFLTEAFHLLRGIGIAGESDGQGGVIEETFVIFDDRVRNNLNAKYLMIINLSFMRSLDSNIAKHLYPLLSHWFWKSTQLNFWRVEYQWLAEHLGIKIWDKLWCAKKQLKSANEELKRKGYIAEYKWEERTLVYFPGPAFEREQSRRMNAKTNVGLEADLIPHTKQEIIDHDPLIPVLNLFAQGIPMAERLLKQRGLTVVQAEALCLERGIQLQPIQNKQLKS